MKLETKRTAEMTPGMTPSEFRIQASAKAFRVLSDNLYSDKVWAVVRELVSNAVDAHKAAGTDRPVRVKLPTVLDPTFEVEDWGTGLSHEQVMTLYTTYFASDKTDTNALIGGFGLGSKSPFCMVDQFTVTSWYNGEKRTYVCMIDGDIPKIVPGPVEPTERHNGVRISLRPPRETMDRWMTAIMRLIPYMPLEVEPEVNVDLPNVMDTFTDGEMEVRLLDSANGKVVLGGVPYSYPSAILQKHALTSYLELHAPIGSLEVAVSRESLAGTEATIRTLDKVIDRAVREFRARTRKKLRITERNLGELWTITNRNPLITTCLRSAFRPKTRSDRLLELDPNNYNVLKVYNQDPGVWVYRVTAEGSITTENMVADHRTMLYPRPDWEKSPPLFIATWGHRRPTTRHLTTLLHDHKLMGRDLFIIHLAFRHNTPEDEVRRFLREYDVPLEALPLYKIPTGKRKQATGGPYVSQHTFNDLLLYLQHRPPEADEVWAILRLPKGVRRFDADWTVRPVHAILDTLHAVGAIKNRVRLFALPWSTPKWVFQVAENAGLCTRLEDLPDAIVWENTRVDAINGHALAEADTKAENLYTKLYRYVNLTPALESRFRDLYEEALRLRNEIRKKVMEQGDSRTRYMVSKLNDSMQFAAQRTHAGALGIPTLVERLRDKVQISVHPCKFGKEVDDLAQKVKEIEDHLPNPVREACRYITSQGVIISHKPEELFAGLISYILSKGGDQ